MTQQYADVRMRKSDGKTVLITCFLPHTAFAVAVYQLGFPTVVLTGNILMNAGLPIKFFTLDDSVMFLLTVKKVNTLLLRCV